MPSAPTSIILAVEGFLELGLADDAESELEKLDGEDRTSREAWVLRCKIYQARSEWPAARDVAKHLVSLFPIEPQYWLWAAAAARKAENVEAGFSILRFGLKFLHDDASILYGLACYEAQLGHLEDAKVHLKAAVELNHELKRSGLDEADLQPVWASIGC